MHSPLLILLIVLSFIVRGLLAFQFDLQPDEAYYWIWSRHLDFSYYDQGPGIAYYIRFFTFILGDSFVALKVAALTGGLLTSFVIYFTGVELKFNRVKLTLLVLTSILIPGFFTGSLVVVHDTFYILCWSAALYFTIRYIDRHRPLDLYAIFVLLALGTLTKYTMVFFAFSLILWILFYKDEWVLFKLYHLYFAILLAALLVSPIIYWNMNHNWDGVDAILNLRSSGGAFASGYKTGEFLIGQMITFSPLLFLMATCSIFVYLLDLTLHVNIKFDTHHRFKFIENVKALTSKFTKHLKENRIPSHQFNFIFINALVLPIFFLFMSFKKTVQANWVFASYPALIVFLIATLPDLNSSVKEWLKKSRILFIVASLFVALLMNVFVFSSSKLMAFLPEDTIHTFIPGARVSGFKEIVQKVYEFQQRVDPTAVIIANRYQDASIASFYLPNKPESTSLNIMQKNQYSYWTFLQKGKNYILFRIVENTKFKSFDVSDSILKYMFQEVEIFPEEDIMIGNTPVKRYQIYYCKNFIRPWDTMLVDYMTKQSILDLMPSLQGVESGRVGNEDTGASIQKMLMMYDSKKGERDCDSLKEILPSCR